MATSETAVTEESHQIRCNKDKKKAYANSEIYAKAYDSETELQKTFQRPKQPRQDFLQTNFEGKQPKPKKDDSGKSSKKKYSVWDPVVYVTSAVHFQVPWKLSFNSQKLQIRALAKSTAGRAGQKLCFSVDT